MKESLLSEWIPAQRKFAEAEISLPGKPDFKPVVSKPFWFSGNPFRILTGVLLVLLGFSQAVDAQCTVSIAGANGCTNHPLTASPTGIPSVIEWKKDGAVVARTSPSWNPVGTVVAGGNGEGNELNQLRLPRGICLDVAGNLYTVEYTRVMKWTPGATAGIVVAGHQFISGGDSYSEYLSGAQDAAVDAAGNVYVADFNNNRIQKWAPGATAGVTVAGGNGQGSGLNQLDGPYRVCLHSNGDLYVADLYNYRILRFSPGQANGVVVAGGNGAGSAANQIKEVNGLVVDDAGNVYINDYLNKRIQKWAPGASAGITIASFTDTPSGLFRDAAGYFYTLTSLYDIYNNYNPYGTVYRVREGDAKPTVIMGGNPTTDPNQLLNAYAVRLDANGNIYTLDVRVNGRVQKFSPAATGLQFTPAQAGSYSAGIIGFDGCTALSNTLNISPSPLATAVPSQTCSGQAVQLSVAAPGNYSWTPLGQTGQSVTVSPTVSTTYTVTDAGSNCSSNVAVLVNQPVTATVAGQSCAVTASLNKEPLKLEWLFNGNTVNTKTAAYGTQQIVAGGNGSGSALNQISAPYGMALDKDGAVYVAELGNDRVTKWLPGSTQGVVVAGGNGRGSGSFQLNMPMGVYVDKAGNVYVSDVGNARVQKFVSGSTSGITVAGANGEGSGFNQLYYPQGLFVDDFFNVYVADQDNHRVVKWIPGASSGVVVAGGNGQGPAANQLYYPADVFVDKNGNVYVSDAGNNRVQKWAPGATEGITVAGGNGRGASLNQLASPTGITMDGAGNLYVVSSGYSQIMRWAPNATQGTYLGGFFNYGNPGSLWAPYSIRLDANGNLFVADVANYRIAKYPVALMDKSYTAATTGAYGVRVISFDGCVSVSNTVNAGAPGDPSQFGNNVWNVYAWNSGGAAINPNAWNTNYAGYYVDDNLNFNTQTKWDAASSPSAAPGYQGCTVGNDNHSWSAKRKGFTCGYYKISITGHDDAGQLFINGTKVWEHNGCCDSHNDEWKGFLNAESAIEFRVTEGGEGSLGALSITPALPAVSATGCTGVSVTLASSSTVNNQWYRNGQLIPGATAQTYGATETGNYSVQVGSTGCAATSEAFTVTISSPAVFGNNVWNVYAWNAGDATSTGGQAWNANYAGYYTETALSFDTRTKWLPSQSPSAAPGYQGCTVGADNHSWAAKRKGFPCAYYSIDIPGHDDQGELWINGTRVWQHIGCCDKHKNVWQGFLGANDEVEFRVTEGGEASYGSLLFNTGTAVLTGTSMICYGSSSGMIAAPVIAGASYRWSPGGETSSSISHLTPGTYSVIISKAGCSSGQASFTIGATPLIVPTISGTTAICPGGSTTLKAGQTGPVIWNAGSYTFQKTSPGQKDEIAAGTHLTRGYNGFIYNAVTQSGPTSSGEVCSAVVENVEWAYGNINDWASLTYSGTPEFIPNCQPPYIINIPMVLHLKKENIYLQLTFTYWQSGGGGNFTYTRTTGPSYLWSTGETTSTISVSSTGTYTLTIATGNGCTNTASQTVTEQKPVVTSVNAPVNPVAVGTSIKVRVDYAGPVNAATIHWGDGTTSTLGSLSSSPLEVPHTYPTPGVYTIGVTLSNNCSSVTVSPQQYVVVYDPSAGFVTGGGWIESPVVSTLPYMQASGKANFGFESKYQRGANVPTGNTEFKFRAGNLSFKSTEYEWLVVAGAKAQFKGSGTVNGGGNFGFMLSAVDGEINGGGGVDKFRIKIWDKTLTSSNNIVYDNQMGAADDATASTAIAGGSIVIHGGNASNSVANSKVLDHHPEISAVLNFKVTAFPNPSSNHFNLVLEGAADKAVSLRVTDLLGREVEVRRNVPANGTLRIGENYKSGVYLIEARQETEKITLKLLKGGK